MMKTLAKIVLIVFLLAFGAPSSFAAIAFDAASSSPGFGVSTTTTWTHTTAGSNRILIVGTQGDDATTGVTYNGVAMTQTATPVQANNGIVRMWYLINPALGANSVVSTLASATGNKGLSVSYTGVLQSGQPDAAASSTSVAGTSTTVSLTTVADKSWTILFTSSNQGAAVTAGTSTVSRAANSTGYGNMLADSNSAKTPAGSVSLAALSNDGFWASGIISISPAPDTRKLRGAGITR